MIRRAHHRSIVSIVAMLALASCLSACGYKGPLYLPANPPAANQPTPAPAPAPVQSVPPSQGPTTIPFLDKDLILEPTPIVIQ